MHQFRVTTLSIPILLGSVAIAAGNNPNIASINQEYTYLLPLPFEGNLTEDFISGTTTDNGPVAAALSAAQSAPFVSYTEEFNRLVGPAVTLETIVANTSYPYRWAGEAGIWVPDLNQVWFSSAIFDKAFTEPYVLYLENNTVAKPPLTVADGYGMGIPLANTAGGYYFNGIVYFCLVGNKDEPPSLVAVDPRTYEVTPVLNSYFGLELPSIDDVAVTYSRTRDGVQTHLFFSTLDLLDSFGMDVGRPSVQLPNAFWKFTLETGELVPIIPRADGMSPNGVAVDRHFKYLYVTDTSETTRFGGGYNWNNTGSPAIYRYDLTDAGKGPVTNKMLFGITREGVSDGMKIDDQGRVWTAEYEGIVVRSPTGKVLGFFNKEVILGSKNPKAEMTNFILAGDTLILLAVDRIQTVKLAETVMRPDRFFVRK